MNYYIDCEFIEGFHKPLFGKRRHFIDLISIGVVCEDGREYYAISKEVSYDDASDWVKANVIIPMTHDWVMSHSGDRRNWALDRIEGKGMKGAFIVVQEQIGKSSKRIRYELFGFFFPKLIAENIGSLDSIWEVEKTEKVTIYGYYSAYDHILMCSIFGKMIDLPNGVPMYTIDLKQMMHERGLSSEWQQQACPDPEGEHNALVDARWNRNLHDIILKTTQKV